MPHVDDLVGLPLVSLLAGTLLLFSEHLEDTYVLQRERGLKSRHF